MHQGTLLESRKHRAQGTGCLPRLKPGLESLLSGIIWHYFKKRSLDSVIHEVPSTLWPGFLQDYNH